MKTKTELDDKFEFGDDLNFRKQLVTDVILIACIGVCVGIALTVLFTTFFIDPI